MMCCCEQIYAAGCEELSKLDEERKAAVDEAAKWRAEMEAAIELGQRSRQIMIDALNQPPEYWYDNHENGQWSAEHAAHAIRELFARAEKAEAEVAAMTEEIETHGNAEGALKVRIEMLEADLERERMFHHATQLRADRYLALMREWVATQDEYEQLCKTAKCSDDHDRYVKVFGANTERHNSAFRALRRAIEESKHADRS